MSEELNVQDTEQQNAADQPECTGTENKNREDTKTFTQEEVDKIVEKRLNRERKKFSSILSGEDPRETELAERERAVAVKELQAEVKEVLRQKNLPLEALELLNYTDKEACDKSIELLENVVKIARQAGIDQLLKGGAPLKRAPSQMEPDMAMRNAFGLR